MGAKYFESMQDIEAATMVKPKTLTEEDSRTASKRGKHDGIHVFEAKGRILRGTEDNVPFAAINLNLYCTFQSCCICQRIM